MTTDINIKLAWLTGIFDGEGCVYVQRSKRKSGNVVCSLSLNIANTSSPLLQKYVSTLEEIGLHPTTFFDARPVGALSKLPIYYVKISRKNEVLALAKLMMEHSTGKRDELQMAIWYLERACETRWHSATPQDREVLAAISAVKHGTPIPKSLRRLTGIDQN